MFPCVSTTLRWSFQEVKSPRLVEGDSAKLHLKVIPSHPKTKKELWCVGCQSGFRFFKMNFWDGWMDPISMSYREDGWRMETWCKLSWSNIDTSTAALRIYTCFTLSNFSLGAQGLKGPRLGRLVAFFNFWATCRSTCRWLQWQIVDQRPVTMMRSMMQWLSQSMSE